MEFECLDELTVGELSSLPNLLTETLRMIVSENIETEVQPRISREDAQKACVSMDLTQYPDFLRLVTVAGGPCPCGGTHVKNTGELGSSIAVTKLKKKKNLLRVSYVL